MVISLQQITIMRSEEWLEGNMCPFMRKLNSCDNKYACDDSEKCFMIKYFMIINRNDENGKVVE